MLFELKTEALFVNLHTKKTIHLQETLFFNISDMSTHDRLRAFRANHLKFSGKDNGDGLKRFSFVIFCLLLLVFATSCITPLMRAAYYGPKSKVEKLIADGADVNKGNPLYQSVFKNNVDIVRILLDKGADVNKGSQNGKTNEWKPIHMAVDKGYVDIVKLLIERGANINVVSPLGKTPQRMAEENGNSLIIHILKDAEDKQYNKLYAKNDEKTDAVSKADIIPTDVDTGIPVGKEVKANTYALIIGNEDYSSYQTGLTTEVNVDFALNDAKIFKEYCIKTLGIPEKQVKLLANATAGQMSQGIAWLNNLAKVDNGKAELIFYYSGHGLPDEQTKEPYLMPVDISGNNVTLGVKLTDVYRKLNEFPSKQVMVFLDACFSGGARNQGLIAMKGVKVKPKENLITGNMVVLSSSTGEESSGVYREKGHGYMTYFLLKKLQESKGDISYKSLADYVIESVTKESALNGKVQTPQLNYSQSVENTWLSWKL